MKMRPKGFKSFVWDHTATNSPSNAQFSWYYSEIIPNREFPSIPVEDVDQAQESGSFG